MAERKNTEIIASTVNKLPTLYSELYISLPDEFDKDTILFINKIPSNYFCTIHDEYRNVELKNIGLSPTTEKYIFYTLSLPVLIGNKKKQFSMRVNENLNKIIYNNLEISPKSVLGYGSFGYVFEYSRDKYKFAVKIGHSEQINLEIDMIDIINKKNLHNLFVKSIVLNNGNKKYIIMNFMDGNLDNNKIKSLNDDIINLCIQLLKYITNVMIILKNNGLWYVDLKPENLLYRCIDENKFELFFGDIGAVFKSSEKVSAKESSYKFTKWTNDDNILITDDIILWHIGVFIFDMIKHSLSHEKFKFMFGNIKEPELTKSINEGLSIFENYKLIKLYLKYLLDYKTNKTLEEFNYKLNNLSG